MKELEPKIVIENHELENQQQEYKFIGQIRRPHLGMKLWAINFETKEVYEVDIPKEIHYDTKTGSTKTTSNLKLPKDTMLTWAINKKNAIRKFNKTIMEFYLKSALKRRK